MQPGPTRPANTIYKTEGGKQILKYFRRVLTYRICQLLLLYDWYIEFLDFPFIQKTFTIFFINTRFFIEIKTLL